MSEIELCQMLVYLIIGSVIYHLRLLFAFMALRNEKYLDSCEKMFSFYVLSGVFFFPLYVTLMVLHHFTHKYYEKLRKRIAK